MKKNYLFLLVFLFSATGLFSQTPRTSTKQQDERRLTWSPEWRLNFRAEMDTLQPPAFADTCALRPAVFVLNDAWGFVSGMNELGDLEKAQRFEFAGSDEYFVRESWGFFSDAGVVNDGELWAKIYTVDGDGSPGNLLGNSEKLKVSDINLDDQDILPTIFSYPNPVRVSNDQFFTSFNFAELYASQDTVALFSTDDGCGGGADAWELFSDGQTWLPVNSDQSWQLNLNFYMFNVIEFGDAPGGGMVATDTVAPPAFADTCALSPVSFTITESWGFVGGTNEFGDLQKAQRISYTQNASYRVSEAWGFFSDAEVVGDGELDINIFSVDEQSGAPGSLLGSSDKLNVSDIVIDDQLLLPTIFPFSTPVAVQDTQFFVSLDISELYASQDTVGLFLTGQDCGDGSDAWDLFSDGVTWLPFDDEQSWQLESNLYLFAVVEFDQATSVDDPFVQNKELRLFPAFPNPASSEVTLRYQLDEASDVTIELYTADGRLIRKMDQGRQVNGEHQQRLDVSALPAGAYVYSIVTSQSRLLSRFVVE